MNAWVAVAVGLSAAVLGCERSSAPRPPVATATEDAGRAVEEQLSGGTRADTEPTPPPTPLPSHGADGSGAAMRLRLGPLVRFQLIPVGKGAPEAARAALPALRQRYSGYGFEVGPALAANPAGDADCDQLLTRILGTRGTLFVFGAPIACGSRFGTVDTRVAAAVVPLEPLGRAGSPEAARRLEALLGADVGALIGLSFPCTGGKVCCPLHQAPTLGAFDAQATSGCVQHAAELSRIRTDAGLE